MIDIDTEFSVSQEFAMHLSNRQLVYSKMAKAIRRYSIYACSKRRQLDAKEWERNIRFLMHGVLLREEPSLAKVCDTYVQVDLDGKFKLQVLVNLSTTVSQLRSMNRGFTVYH